MLASHIHDLAQQVLALAPTPTPSPTGNPDDAVLIHTDDVIAAGVKFLLPLASFFIGLVIIGRAKRGRVSEVATTSGVYIWGLLFIAGGAVFFSLGDKLVHLFLG